MSTEIPKLGTDERRWWTAGATAEARAIRDGMQKGKATELYDFVLTMAQQGYGPETMTSMVANVYTCEYPLGKRLAFAWSIIWGPYGLKISSARARRRQRKAETS